MAVEEKSTFGDAKDTDPKANGHAELKPVTKSTIELITKGRNRKRVDLPEMGIYVYVCDLKSKRAYELAKTGKDESKNFDQMVDLVIETACTETGEMLFSSADRVAVEDMPFGALHKLINGAMAVNGLSVEGLEEYKGK